MNAKVEQTPETNLNPVLSVKNDGTVLYSSETSEPILNEWGVRVGEKLPSSIVDLVQRVLSRNSPEKIEVKVGKKLYLIVFHPSPEEACVKISGFYITDNKELEENHPESGKNYQKLFEKMHEAFFIADVITNEAGVPVDYRIIEANKAIEAQTGVSLENFIGNTALGMYPELDPFWINTYGHVALTGEPIHFEHYADVQERHYEVLAYQTHPSQFAAIFLDITERKRDEDALQKSEEQYRTLFQSMGEGFAIAEMELDLEGKPVDYVILEINQAYERQAGLCSEQVLGRRVTEFLDQVEPVWFERYGRVVSKGEPQRFEEYNASLDRWFSVYAFPLPIRNRFGMIFSDITERKKAEERIRYLASLVDTVSDAIISTDNSYHITSWNKAAETIYGWKAEEVIGKISSEVLNSRYQNSETVEEIRDKFHRNELTFFETIHTTKTGREINVLGRSNTVRDSGGKAIGVVSVFRDITKRKRAEEALRESEEKKAFLLKLSDTLRPLSDANSIMDATTHLLVEHLGVSQASYSEYTEDSIVIHSETLNGATQSLTVAGAHKLNDFSESFAILRAGKDLIVPDVLSFSEYSEEERAHLTALNIRANISVPLVKEGKLVAVLTVRQSTPRKWTPFEISLVQDTAERTWAAVERARAEEALKESERRFKALSEATPIGAGASSVDGVLRYANPSFERILGYGQGELLGKKVYDAWWNAEDRNAWLNIIKKNGVVRDFEAKLRKKDGTAVWGSMGGAPILFGSEPGVMGTIQDITDRKKAEEMLRESELKYRSLSNTLEERVKERTDELEKVYKGSQISSRNP